jgi:hypothetical protein
MNCAYCHTTRFGLARYQLLTLKGYVYFDRKRCRDGYLKAIQGEELNRKAFIELPAGADRQADATASQWG